jgi:hypothetical protein
MLHSVGPLVSGQPPRPELLENVVARGRLAMPNGIIGRIRLLARFTNSDASTERIDCQECYNRPLLHFQAGQNTDLVDVYRVCEC